MKILIILTGGRSGSGLLQSLFDGHKEILQFPGELLFTDEIKKIFKENSPPKFVNSFINFNQHFFDSRLNTIERHNKLGSLKNEFYKVDKNNFKKRFLKLFKISKKTNLDKLICLHKAYEEKANNLSKKKVIVLHIHDFIFFKNYLQIFKIKENTKIFLTMRDPIVSLCSTINNWLKYKDGIYLTPGTLERNFDTHFNIFNNLHFLRKKIKVIKLEKLHQSSRDTLKKICKHLNIKFSQSLLKSTYHGKKWWGDCISQKYLNGLNPKFKNKFDEDLFSIKELKFLEKKILPVLKKYKYPIRSEINSEINILYFYPFGFEKKIWAKTLKKNKLKTSLSIPYFYIRRILLLGKKNIFLQNNLPNEI